MKFKQTNYLGTKQILKFPDHKVAMTVTVSDEGVTVNEDGEKIVEAGTIVSGGGVLLDPSKAVSDVNLGAKAASFTTTFTTENSNLTFVAKEKGVDGNSIKVAFVAPTTASQELSVSVASNVITVNLATDETKTVTTVADDVIAIILENTEAQDLVDVMTADGNSGSGTVSALVATALAGGTAGAGGVAEGVLENDVDVTYGPALGAMLVHGFIDIKKMPIEPTTADIEALKQITFLG
ncbi:hypothetical protein [Anaerosinus massiliensis]|uniref:hypothetical protein n=1 Tax=Massilibacillus massiliensis TaxID=1806837 RepID=UPI000A6EDD31|nr:hypothetical protein [Massilibacillus massiliensis]